MGLQATASRDHRTDPDTKMLRNHRALHLEKKGYSFFPILYSGPGGEKGLFE
jgi:hypothetical protein